jgi:hypothetical protein
MDERDKISDDLLRDDRNPRRPEPTDEPEPQDDTVPGDVPSPGKVPPTIPPPGN